MSQGNVSQIDLPVIFQKGAGIFLALPICPVQNSSEFDDTQFQHSKSNLRETFNQLEQRLTNIFPQDRQYILGNILILINSIGDLYFIYPRQFPQAKQTLFDGFVYNNYLYKPLLPLLSKCNIDSVKEFLTRIEKCALDLRTNENGMIDNFKAGMQNITENDLKNAFANPNSLASHIQFSKNFDQETQNLLIAKKLKSIEHITNRELLFDGIEESTNRIKKYLDSTTARLFSSYSCFDMPGMQENIDQLIHQLDLAGLSKYLDTNKYHIMINDLLKRLNDKQVKQIPCDFIKNLAPDKLTEFLEYKPKQLTTEQILCFLKENLGPNDRNKLAESFSRAIGYIEKIEISLDFIKNLAPDKQNEFKELLKYRVDVLTKDQIQAIEIKSKLDSDGLPITDDKYAPIAAILLLNRAKDLTLTQIQNIDLWRKRYGQVVNVYAEVEKRNKDKDRLILLRDAHRFGDLSDNQINRCIHFGYTSNVKEILFSHLENRIKPQLIGKVNGKTDIEEELDLPALKKDLTTEQYLRMISAWYEMFSDGQIKQIPCETIKNLDPDALTKILEIKVNDFTKDQIQAIEIKSKLNSNGTPITDDKYAPIAAILLLHRINDMTDIQIQSIDLWWKRGDKVVNVYAEVEKRNKDKYPLILLRDAHRFGDLSNGQINRCIHFGKTSYIKEILFSHLENKITPQLQEGTKQDGKTKLQRQLDLPTLKKDLTTGEYRRMVSAWLPMFGFKQVIQYYFQKDEYGPGPSNYLHFIYNRWPNSFLLKRASVGIMLINLDRAPIEPDYLKYILSINTDADRESLKMPEQLYFAKCMLCARDTIKNDPIDIQLTNT